MNQTDTSKPLKTEQLKDFTLRRLQADLESKKEGLESRGIKYTGINPENAELSPEQKEFIEAIEGIIADIRSQISQSTSGFFKKFSTPKGTHFRSDATKELFGYSDGSGSGKTTVLDAAIAYIETTLPSISTYSLHFDSIIEKKGEIIAAKPAILFIDEATSHDNDPAGIAALNTVIKQTGCLLIATSNQSSEKIGKGGMASYTFNQVEFPDLSNRFFDPPPKFEKNELSLVEVNTGVISVMGDFSSVKAQDGDFEEGENKYAIRYLNFESLYNQDNAPVSVGRKKIEKILRGKQDNSPHIIVLESNVAIEPENKERLAEIANIAKMIESNHQKLLVPQNWLNILFSLYITDKDKTEMAQRVALKVIDRLAQWNKIEKYEEWKTALEKKDVAAQTKIQEWATGILQK